MAIPKNLNLDLDWIVRNPNVPSDYYKCGAYVYENVNGHGIRRHDREDSVPFRDEPSSSITPFLGPSHAVLGNGNWRVAFLGTRDAIYILDDNVNGKLLMYHIDIKNKEDGNEGVFAIADNVVRVTFSEGLLDVVVTDKKTDVWKWRATIGENYGSGYNEFDASEVEVMFHE